MSTIEHQQKVAIKFYKYLKENVDNTAVLTGGAPRDWYLCNRAAQDLDFYVHIPSNLCFTIKELLPDGFKELQPTKEQYRSAHIDKVFESILDGVKVQVMQTGCRPYTIGKSFPVSTSTGYCKLVGNKLQHKASSLGGASDLLSGFAKVKRPENNKEVLYIKKAISRMPELVYLYDDQSVPDNARHSKCPPIVDWAFLDLWGRFEYKALRSKNKSLFKHLDIRDQLREQPSLFKETPFGSGTNLF